MLLQTLYSIKINTQEVIKRFCLSLVHSCCTATLHSELSCELEPTIKSSEGSLLLLCALRLDPWDLLDSPLRPTLLLFDPLLPISRAFCSASGNLLIAILLLCSPLDLSLLALAFFGLPAFGLLSGDFAGSCGDFLSWGGVIGGCGWTMGRFIRVGKFICAAPLPMTTSVRQSSSVCSFAKLTNTYRSRAALVTRWFILYYKS